MSTQIILVSEEKLKSFTQMHSNVQVASLTPNIVQAQDLYLQPILGTRFYDHIKDAAQAGTLTAVEQTLLNDYIAYALMNRAFAMTLPFIKYKIVDKGIVSGESPETSSSTTLDDLKYLIDKVTDTAQFYEERLREYLCQNDSDFPLWTSTTDNGMNPDKSSPYFSGLVTPAHRFKKYIDTYEEDENCYDC